MLVALVVIRLEQSDDFFGNLNHINYEAPHFKIATDYEYTIMDDKDSTCDGGPSSGPSVSSKTLIDINRGQRVHSEMSVETYYSDEASTSTYSMVVKRPLSTSSEDPTTPTVSPRDKTYMRLGSAELHESPESQHSDDTRSVGSSDGVTRHVPRQKTSRISPKLHYFSGNPTVEITKGILHLYKDNKMVSTNEDVPRSDMICLLTVPATHTIHDLIQFLAPVSMSIEYMRIIRDTKPNNYMVLLKFYDQKLADDFYSNYNNIEFNSLESHICHLVYVARVEAIGASQGGSLPVPGLTELPNCPVCLERMDESVDGVLTILCNHSFHISCLSQCTDTTCPVCRYMQTPEQSAENKCHECGSQESLWICLVCGHVGCGRYVEMHAYWHFQQTHHCYSMHLGNNHVWDYAGDNYVHRLVQNKTDGKLVEVDEGGNLMREEKLDSLNLEYTYLLTSQLESQRMYFEEKMNKIEEDSKKEVETLRMQYESQISEHSQLKKELATVSKEKQTLDKKYNQLHSRLTKVLNELQDEKQMNTCLVDNGKDWQEQVTRLQTELQNITTKKDSELNDLREELRDVLFHIEAQRELSQTNMATQEEIETAGVTIGAAAPQTSRKTRKKGR